MPAQCYIHVYAHYTLSWILKISFVILLNPFVFTQNLRFMKLFNFFWNIFQLSFVFNNNLLLFHFLNVLLFYFLLNFIDNHQLPNFVADKLMNSYSPALVVVIARTQYIFILWDINSRPTTFIFYVNTFPLFLLTHFYDVCC